MPFVLFEKLTANWSELGLPPSSLQVAQFARYTELLLEWNERINLTAIKEPDEIVVKHFLDSLSLLSILDNIPSKQLSLIDVGSGAGFPGMALAIMRPDWQITLLEATRKKVYFLKAVQHELKLPHVTLLWGRAEEMGQQATHRQQYDVAVARAVASLSVLAEYCLPFVRVGGLWVAQKGSNIQEEVKRSRNALGQLGGKLRTIDSISLPGIPDQQRSLVIVQKVKSTAKTFPRRPGVPRKRPL